MISRSAAVIAGFQHITFQFGPVVLLNGLPCCLFATKDNGTVCNSVLKNIAPFAVLIEFADQLHRRRQDIKTVPARLAVFFLRRY